MVHHFALRNNFLGALSFSLLFLLLHDLAVSLSGNNVAYGQTASDYADKRRKVALTIGVANYQKAHPLRNPLRDVGEVSKRLQEIGFDTVRVENTTREQADHSIKDFISRSKNADIALIYYSGHGLQIDGENYIVPTDFDPDKSDITDQLISVSRLLDSLNARAKVKIILLDACRDNPFADILKNSRHNFAVSKGLAPFKAASLSDPAYGLIVGYATQPNDVANDGTGVTSPYAAGLLQATLSPDEDFNLSLVKAARIVVAQTNGVQRPEHRVALTQPLFLLARPKPLACDILAAETDNNVSVKGVEFDKIETDAAISACRADLGNHPDNPRLIHNLARSLDKAGSKVEAVNLYRRAAEQGFDWSQNNLAVMYLQGEGVDPDPKEAMLWMRKAFAQGNRQAVVNYADTDMVGLFSDSKENTKHLQRALTRAGYYKRRESGVLDNQTKSALAAYKLSKGFRGTGITFQVMDALDITSLVLHLKHR